MKKMRTKEILIILTLLIIASPNLFAKFSIKVYFKDASTPKEYDITSIKRLEISDFNDEYTMKLYSGASITHSYSTSIIDSIKFNTSNQITVYTTGTDDNYYLTNLDSIIFQYSTGIDTVRIGTQTWMRRNLDVTHYRNGDTIPEVRDAATWANLTTGAWCYYNNNPAYDSIYGKLYNWYAVNESRGLAPAGWHVPSDNEWKTLEMYLGMSQSEANETGWRGSTEGGKLKETGTNYWIFPNTGATNSSGFSTLPGGYRYYGGAFYLGGNAGNWWSSTESYGSGIWVRSLVYDYAGIHRYSYDKRYGYSVRCVRD